MYRDGIDLSTATLGNFNQAAFDALAPFEVSVLSSVKEAPVKNLDETGFRIAGKTQWLHVASTSTATYYHVSPKRKSLIDGLVGTVVHDHWKSYYNLSGVEHGLCHQHHLRELKAITAHDQEAWAQKMSRLLRVALRCRHFHVSNMIPKTRIKWLTNLYNKIISQGLAFHKNLPPLPMMKCKQKISGGFRSPHGAKQFARIRGFISTIRKCRLNILSSIQAVFSGNIPMFAGN